MAKNNRQATMTLVAKDCVCCASLLLLLLVPYTSSSLLDEDLTRPLLQEYPQGDEAEVKALERLLRDALPETPSEAKLREILSPGRDVRRHFRLPYLAKRQPSPLAFLGSRGKRQPDPRMFFGSRGRRQLDIYQTVKRLDPNTFLGSRGKRFYSFEDGNDLEEAMSIYERRRRAQPVSP